MSFLHPALALGIPFVEPAKLNLITWLVGAMHHTPPETEAGKISIVLRKSSLTATAMAKEWIPALASAILELMKPP
jgi:hypothetical protein